jgi:Ser/Thr protein kinase RdoA (MazF antagonist)
MHNLIENMPNESCLVDAMSRWKLSEEPKFMRKVGNFVFQSTTEKGKVVLRLTNKSDRTYNEIVAELDFQCFLAQRFTAVVQPILSEQGNSVEEFENHFGVLFSWAAGCPVKKDDLTDTLYEKLGHIVGEIHVATRSYRATNGVKPRCHWNEDTVFSVVEKEVLLQSKEMQLEFYELYQRVNNLSKNAENYRLIHGDIHHGNYWLTGDGDFSIFDFDDCCYHWLEYDLVVAIFAFYTSNGGRKKWQEIMEKIVSAYLFVDPSLYIDKQRLVLLLAWRCKLVDHYTSAGIRNATFNSSVVKQIQKEHQLFRRLFLETDNYLTS